MSLGFGELRLGRIARPLFQQVVDQEDRDRDTTVLGLLKKTYSLATQMTERAQAWFRNNYLELSENLDDLEKNL